MTFSEREGFAKQKPITIFYDAPEAFRSAVATILRHSCEQSPKSIRESLCLYFIISPDAGNWSDSNVMIEVEGILSTVEWSELFDYLEFVYAKFQREYLETGISSTGIFETQINRALEKLGMGWAFKKGRFVRRGEPVDQALTEKAHVLLDGYPIAQKELKTAMSALSVRPEPDTTVAINHSLLALESVTRKLTPLSEGLTLGQIINKNSKLFPGAVSEAIKSLYGYANGHTRHGTEERKVSLQEAYLVVGVVSSSLIYLLEKIPEPAA